MHSDPGSRDESSKPVQAAELGEPTQNDPLEIALQHQQQQWWHNVEKTSMLSMIVFCPKAITISMQQSKANQQSAADDAVAVNAATA